MAPFAILILAFKRIDFVIERIQEVIEFASEIPIFVSVDGSGITKPELESKIQKYIGKITVIYQDKNYGVDGHYFKVVEDLIYSYQYLLIVEDDVKVLPKSIMETMDLISQKEQVVNAGGEVCLNGFGLIPLPNSEFYQSNIRNKWYLSTHFVSWGHVINSFFWIKVKMCRSLIDEPHLIDVKLKEMRMPKRHRTVWIDRFQRGNFDYCLQMTIFLFDLRVGRPIFRLFENVGFGDPNATHTRFRRPWFFGPVAQKCPRNATSPILINYAITRLLNWLEKANFAGSSILNRRGRILGVRTLIKSFIKRL
jgi:hypothetical protein